MVEFSSIHQGAPSPSPPLSRQRILRAPCQRRRPPRTSLSSLEFASSAALRRARRASASAPDIVPSGTSSAPPGSETSGGLLGGNRLSCFARSRKGGGGPEREAFQPKGSFSAMVHLDASEDAGALQCADLPMHGNEGSGNGGWTSVGVYIGGRPVFHT